MTPFMDEHSEMPVFHLSRQNDCNDTALARASSLPASWLTAWVLWTGFFLLYYGGNVRTKYSKTSVFPRLYRVFPRLYAIRKPVGP